MAATTGFGLWLGRKQSNARDYFVADRSLPWWAVCFSIVAAETSALTFISIPGLAYAGNFGFLEVVAGYVVGRIAIAAVLLPRYFDGDLVTAYTLLETRFGKETRRFTSVVFMVTRAMADSVRVFATAIPIALIIGPVVPRQYLMPSAILILGALTILYTYQGGMRAVVWTELVQTGVYLNGGLAAALLLGRSAPTPAQRAAAIESALRCPSCEDLSVAASSAPTAVAASKKRSIPASSPWRKSR